MIRYECCEGYQQVPGQQGCTGGTVLYDFVFHNEYLAALTRVLLEKLIVAKLPKNFYTIDGMQLFIIIFGTAGPWIAK
jgi:hypothetical protein